MGFDGGATAERSLLNPDKAFQGLTVQMERFAEARFLGANASEAYLAAYNVTTDKPETIGRQAHEIDNHPKVVARINQLQLARTAQTTLAPKIDKNFVLTRLGRLADEAKRDGDKIRALELLGKTVDIDIFREHTITEKRERTPEDVKRDLIAKLEALRPIIEGTSHQVAAIPPGVDTVAPRVQRKRKPIAT